MGIDLFLLLWLHSNSYPHRVPSKAKMFQTGRALSSDTLCFVSSYSQFPHQPFDVLRYHPTIIIRLLPFDRCRNHEVIDVFENTIIPLPHPSHEGFIRLKNQKAARHHTKGNSMQRKYQPWKWKRKKSRIDSYEKKWWYSAFSSNVIKLSPFSTCDANSAGFSILTDFPSHHFLRSEKF